MLLLAAKHELLYTLGDWLRARVHINNVMQGCSSHKGSSKSEPQFIKELCPEKGNLNLWLAQRDLGAADDDVVAGRSISIRA